MKISNETIAVLKNFSVINKGLVIQQGNTLRTRTKAVFAEATIAEEFPLEVGIYDLPNLLNAIALFKEPEFDFQEDCLRITDVSGKAKIVYAYAGAGLVQLSTKKKNLELPSDTIDFILTEDELVTIQKAVSVLQKPEICISSDGKEVRIGTEDHKQQKGNAYSLVVDGEPHGFSCNMVFDIDNLKFLKGSYEVSVAPYFTQFKNASGHNLRYLIGPEPTSSTFGAAD